MSGFGTMKSDMDMCLMITEDGVCIVLCLYVHVLYTVKQPSFLTLFILPFVHNEMGHDYYF